MHHTSEAMQYRQAMCRIPWASHTAPNVPLGIEMWAEVAQNRENFHFFGENFSPNGRIPLSDFLIQNLAWRSLAGNPRSAPYSTLDRF